MDPDRVQSPLVDDTIDDTLFLCAMIFYPGSLSLIFQLKAAGEALNT